MTPETHRIVYTRFSDGGVAITQLAQECLGFWLGNGGQYAGEPRWFRDEIVRRKSCPVLQRGHPCTEDAAWACVKAYDHGGLTLREAFAVERDHSCARFGYSFEVMRLADLPQDPWFRDAFRRNHNGAVVIDFEACRAIQWREIKTAAKREEQRREFSLDEWSNPIKIDWRRIDSAIRHARDEEELRKVWPEELAA